MNKGVVSKTFSLLPKNIYKKTEKCSMVGVHPKFSKVGGDTHL